MRSSSQVLTPDGLTKRELEVGDTGSPRKVRRTHSNATASGTSASARHQEPEFRNLDDFKVGQILGVELTNFQVCARGSYQFKPFLNLVVGPNGSGKSTVITAIFLLMNGEQKDTSRSSSDDFIRIGCNTARATLWILDGESKPRKISMLLNRGQKPIYELSDKPVDREVINRLTSEYHIQVNNRCQFLPQERVASFSAETSHQRLISTLESVGEKSMVSSLEKLITFGANVREHQGSAGENDDKIATLTSEKEKQTANVEILKQRYEEKKELEVLRSIEVLVRYQDAKTTQESVQAKLKSLRRDERDFRSKNKHLYENKQKYLDLGQVGGKATTNAEREHGELGRELDGLLTGLKAESQNTTMADLESLEIERDRSSTVIKTLRSSMKKTSEEIEKQRNELDHDALLEAEGKSRAIAEEVRSLVEGIESTRSQVNAKELKIQALERNRSLLQNERNKAVEDRFRMSFQGNKIREAMQIVNENRHLFRQKVYPPPLTTLKISPGAEKQVNSVLPLSGLELFICQNDNDFQALSKLFDEKSARFRIVTTRGNWAPNANLRNKLIEMGFDGVISDLIHDEAPVLNYLVMSGQLDSIPYTVKSISPQTESAVKSLPGMPVKKYLTSTHSVRFIQSRYGQRQVSETRQKLWDKFEWVFKFKTSPTELHSAREAETAKLTQQITDLRSDLDSLSERQQELDSQRLQKLNEKLPFSSVIKKQKTLQKMIENGQKNLEEVTKELSAAKAAAKTFEERERKLAEKLLSKFAISSCNRISSKALNVIPQSFEYTKARADCVESKSALKRIDHEVNGLLEAIRRDIERYTGELNTAKQKLEEIKPKITELKTKLTEQDFKAAEAKSVEMSRTQVQEAIANLEASLALSENGESYEQALAMLEQTTERLEILLKQKEAASSRLTAAQRELDSLAPEFERKAREFVEGISAKYADYFERLGCTGKVELLAPPLKFEDWGIEIKVSYRDGEALRALSAKTQSGGEKAVATAVYLMALQGYSKAPFFVVDEINQGMDKINERAVHKFIVQTACTNNPRQYFMVTPKLLPDLYYHPNMKILCHNSNVNVITA